jgi:Na+-transporting methylmalonyl-CoA/oxaloacetate decarboxylase gamma subunit
MTLADALTVTALGMGVVFIGLILTSLLIVTFNLAPRLLRRSDGDVTIRVTTEHISAPAISPKPEDDRVVAAIITVLDVERRLYRSEEGGRLTIDRTR